MTAHEHVETWFPALGRIYGISGEGGVLDGVERTPWLVPKCGCREVECRKAPPLRQQRCQERWHR